MGVGEGGNQHPLSPLWILAFARMTAGIPSKRFLAPLGMTWVCFGMTLDAPSFLRRQESTEGCSAVIAVGPRRDFAAGDGS